MEQQKVGITDYLKAGYWGFYLQTEEIDRAVNLVTKEIKEYYGDNGNIATWSLSAETPDAMEPLMKLDLSEANTVLILKNYHWFIKDDQTGNANFEITQFIQDRIDIYRSKDRRKVIVIVAPVAASEALPKELVREFIPLKFDLPDEESIEEILKYTMMVLEKNPKFKKPSNADKKRLIQAAKGMGKAEIENSFFLSVVKTGGKLDPKVVTDQKMSHLEEVAGIKYLEPDETFENLLGHENIKKFALATAPHLKAKGLLLLGPTGTGKTHFVRALGGEIGIPVVEVEMAEWFGSLVGETEEKVRRGIAGIIAIGRCIVLVDEIEKALAGVQGGKGGHAGHETTQRAMAQWLKFMGNRPDGIYLAATCNNISGLPPEYIRAERWDTAPFFVDLPNPLEQAAILSHYKKEYKVDGKIKKGMEGWSGAEIKACCRLAHIMKTDIGKASQFVIPVSMTMETEISELRTWAKNRTLPASEVKVNGEIRRSIDL